MPFAGINKKSFYTRYLIDLIPHVLVSENVNKIYLVSDNVDISTTEFIEQILSAAGLAQRLFWMPKRSLPLPCVFGEEGGIQPAFDNLLINNINVRTILLTPKHRLKSKWKNFHRLIQCSLIK